MQASDAVLDCSRSELQPGLVTLRAPGDRQGELDGPPWRPMAREHRPALRESIAAADPGAEGP